MLTSPIEPDGSMQPIVKFFIDEQQKEDEYKPTEYKPEETPPSSPFPPPPQTPKPEVIKGKNPTAINQKQQ